MDTHLCSFLRGTRDESRLPATMRLPSTKATDTAGDKGKRGVIGSPRPCDHSHAIIFT